MNELETRIMGILREHGVPHEVFTHDPVYTNPELAERLGVPVSETVKNLMLKASDGRVVQVVLPGDKRFDSKRVARKVGVKNVRFAEPETVLEMAGCEIGCVPPFGHVRSVPVYMDRQLLWREHVYFNPGVHDKTVRIESRSLKELCKPTML